MAKPKGPCFALSALGSIAKTLVYFRSKGRNVLRQHVVPHNPKTVAQVTTRGHMQDLATEWRNPLRSGADNTAYRTLSKFTPGGLNGWNVFCKLFKSLLDHSLQAAYFYQGTATFDPDTGIIQVNAGSNIISLEVVILVYKPSGVYLTQWTASTSGAGVINSANAVPDAQVGGFIQIYREVDAPYGASGMYLITEAA
jgi:hypothetical protein